MRISDWSSDVCSSDLMTDFMAVAIREAGKTIPDAVAEVREAVDFLRYYAVRAEADFAPLDLPGPTGEENRLFLAGRGVCACISPGNFPLALFMGQLGSRSCRERECQAVYILVIAV